MNSLNGNHDIVQCEKAIMCPFFGSHPFPQFEVNTKVGAFKRETKFSPFNGSSYCYFSINFRSSTAVGKMGQAAKKWKICSEGACMIILLRKKYYTRNLVLQTYVLNSTSLMRLASLLSKSPFAINNRRAFHLGALLMF